MDLSILIINWNTGDLLAQCLDSLQAHPPQGEWEAIVIDNASQDDSARRALEQHPWIRLETQTENLGFGRANNLGMRLCRGRAVLLLNPDTLVQHGALRQLQACLEEHPQAGAIGPRLFNPDGSLQFSCSPWPSLGRELWRLLHLPGVRPDGYAAMGAWQTDRIHRAQVLLGACMLLPRQALDQVGGFDEEFFMYSEEVDLCHRLHQHGWELYWEPRARVTHLGGQSTRQAASEMFLNLYASKLLYFRKHRGQAAAGIYKAILGLTAYSRLLGLPLARTLAPARRQEYQRVAQQYRQLLTALPGL